MTSYGSGATRRCGLPRSARAALHPVHCRCHPPTFRCGRPHCMYLYLRSGCLCLFRSGHPRRDIRLWGLLLRKQTPKANQRMGRSVSFGRVVSPFASLWEGAARCCQPSAPNPNLCWGRGYDSEMASLRQCWRLLVGCVCVGESHTHAHSSLGIRTSPSTSPATVLPAALAPRRLPCAHPPTVTSA